MPQSPTNTKHAVTGRDQFGSIRTNFIVSSFRSFFGGYILIEADCNTGTRLPATNVAKEE